MSASDPWVDKQDQFSERIKEVHPVMCKDNDRNDRYALDNQSEPLLREAADVLKQVEKILLRDSASRDRDGNIAQGHYVGQAILLCRSPKPSPD